MGLAAGIASAFGMATEVTPGTYQAPDHFYEFLPGETLKYTQKRIFSKAIRNGRRVQARWAASVADVAGDISFELPNRALAFMLKHCLGTVSSTLGTPRTFADGVTNTDTSLVSATATFVANDVGMFVSGAGIPVGTTIASRTNGTTVVLSQATTATATGVSVSLGAAHTITPGDLAGVTFTAQIARPDVGGTKRIFSYIGCKIAKWDVSAKVGEYAQLKANIYGGTEDTSQSQASVSYGSGLSPFVYTQGTVTANAVATDVMEFAFTADNNVAKGRHFIRATTPVVPKEALENGYRPISGSLKCDFNDLTLYNLYKNATEFVIVLLFQASATSVLKLTMNCEFDGADTNIATEGLVPQMLPFTVLSATSDAVAITALVGSSETTP